MAPKAAASAVEVIKASEELVMILVDTSLTTFFLLTHNVDLVKKQFVLENENDLPHPLSRHTGKTRYFEKMLLDVVVFSYFSDELLILFPVVTDRCIVFVHYRRM